MKKNVVDMGRVRKALSELDRLAAEHPNCATQAAPAGRITLTNWTS